MAKIIPFLGFLLLIPSVILNIYFFKNQNQPGQYAVTRVIDGDTFETSEHVIYRLNGVNAPELDMCGGVEAKQELEKNVLNKKVIIKTNKFDNFNRPLGDVYLQNGDSLNVVLLKSGWIQYEYVTTSEKELAKKASSESRIEKRGIYSDKCTQYTNPVNPKCSIKGNYSDSNHTIKLYSFLGCQQYETTLVQLSFGDQWFCSEEEAVKAGFVKSEACRDKKF